MLKLVGLFLSLEIAILVGVGVILGSHLATQTLIPFWTQGLSLTDAWHNAWLQTFFPPGGFQVGPMLVHPHHSFSATTLKLIIGRNAAFIIPVLYAAAAAFLLLFLARMKPRESVLVLAIAWTFFALGTSSTPVLLSWSDVQQALLMLTTNFVASWAICCSFVLSWKLGKLIKNG